MRLEIWAAKSTPNGVGSSKRHPRARSHWILPASNLAVWPSRLTVGPLPCDPRISDWRIADRAAGVGQQGGTAGKALAAGGAGQREVAEIVIGGVVETAVVRGAEDQGIRLVVRAGIRAACASGPVARIAPAAGRLAQPDERLPVQQEPGLQRLEGDAIPGPRHAGESMSLH